MVARRRRRCSRERHVEALITIIPKHLSPYFTRTAAEIYRDVIDDYGEVEIRNFWRALKLLRGQKAVLHVGPLHGGRYQLPPPPKQGECPNHAACRRCGGRKLTRDYAK